MPSRPKLTTQKGIEMTDNTGGETTDFSALAARMGRYGMRVVTVEQGPEVLARLQAKYTPLEEGEATSFSPVANFLDEPDAVMEVFQRIAGLSLPAERYALAKQVAMDACAKVVGVPSVLVLVAAWRSVPALTDFAEAVAAHTLPS